MDTKTRHAGDFISYPTNRVVGFAPVGSCGQHHDDETTGPHVLHMTAKMRRLLDRTSQSNQCSLELSEEAVFGSAGIQAIQILLPVKDVDVFPIYTCPNERLDGGPGALGISNVDIFRRQLDSRPRA